MLQKKSQKAYKKRKTGPISLPLFQILRTASYYVYTVLKCWARGRVARPQSYRVLCGILMETLYVGYTLETKSLQYYFLS